MPYNPKCLANLHQYKEGVSGNPNGSSKKAKMKAEMKKKVMQQMRDVYGVKDLQALIKKRMELNDVDEWELAIMTMNQGQLQTLIKWEDCPAYAKGVAISVLMDMKNGKTRTLDKLRDRQFGKVIQKVEITGKDGEPLNQSQVITPEEARKILDNLEKEF